MFYVYVLQSEVDQHLYIGYSADLKSRFKQHNEKKVKSTKPYAPWILVYYQAFKDKKDATKEEKRLKLHAAKSDLKNRLKYSLK